VQGGDLEVDVGLRLDQQPGAGGQQSLEFGGRFHHPDALAVIAAGDRLGHHRPAHPTGEADRGGQRICFGGQVQPGRPRYRQLGHPGPHRRLVLGEAQRRRPGQHPDPGLGQRPQVLGRHVLVVEGHYVATPGEVLQVRQRPVVADHHVAGHQRRPVVRRVGQQPQRLAERDRGLMGHPGQLAGADHADRRQSGTCVHGS
jgi:hypothetical protein